MGATNPILTLPPNSGGTTSADRPHLRRSRGDTKRCFRSAWDIRGKPNACWSVFPGSLLEYLCVVNFRLQRLKVLLEELNYLGGNEANIMRTHRVPRSTLYDARKRLKVAKPPKKEFGGNFNIKMLRPTFPLPKSLTTLCIGKRQASRYCLLQG